MTIPFCKTQILSTLWPSSAAHKASTETLLYSSAMLDCEGPESLEHSLDPEQLLDVWAASLLNPKVPEEALHWSTQPF